MASSPIIQLRNVAMLYEGSREVKALENANLDIKENEFVTLVGPSGCGKSTILNLLAGLLTPTAGDVMVRGARVDGLNRTVGYVTQADNLLPWRTLQQNVEIGLEVRNVPRTERRERAQEIIDRMGLTGFEQAYPHELSGGMRQRGNIARTLIWNPDIILMDEPFGPLDALTRSIMQNQLLEIWQAARKTVVFVTHDLHEALALADKVVVMASRPGRIKLIQEVAIPRPRDIFSVQRHPLFEPLYEKLLAAVLEEMKDSLSAATWEKMVAAGGAG